MKRLLLLLTLFASVNSFAHFSTTTPLFGVQHAKTAIKAPFVDPTVIYMNVVKQPDGNLGIAIICDPWTPIGQAWKATIGVRTYRLIGFRWQWVTMLYDIIIPGDNNNGGDIFVIGSNWQYVGHASPAIPGELVLDDDQYYLAAWGPQ